ncbi:hypothetical protein SEA_PUPPER_24 [Gordonia phage Pupper]|uniref:Uncharacterized protein n=1 Tax=Gordonia phage Pupper TaxID=2571249 RepID=A0A4Y6EM74_9CAUD|nr:hypothetical protein KHQ83_gp024 [Gordonia phage Pupper]QDF18511.1 hypothetical protein SEA_PUPPER_24 [Gordonia phage Pupper]QDF18744.1 hypothetical protein SEA_SCENTAE_24 [Gordonia phage SCentae]
MADIDRVRMGAQRSGWKDTLSDAAHQSVWTFEREGTVITVTMTSSYSAFGSSRIHSADIVGGPRDIIAEHIRPGEADKGSKILKWMERPRVSALAAVYDVEDVEPIGVLAVESLSWINYGWGDGPTFVGPAAAEDALEDETNKLLTFTRLTHGWMYRLGGKSIVDWPELVRRFGPVRVTEMKNKETN